MKIEIITKSNIEKIRKEIKKEISEDINKTLDKKFKEKEQEKARLEKQAIKKQSEISDRAWNKVKNKELRLSEIESWVVNIENNQKEFLKSITEKFNELVDKFNDHIKGELVKR